MINNEFDIVYERRTPGNIKYKPIKGCTDIIPMWIADMDFKAPDAVRKALIESAEQNMWGYTEAEQTYDKTVVSWYGKRLGWSIEADHILKMPGVMFAISSAIRALTKPGESVMICQPVYYPFAKIITENKRNLVVSELIPKNGRYEIRFDDFEDKIIQNDVKMFVFCSPHNPVGRVWTRDELEKIADICQRYDVWIVSDEIHSDIVLGENKHIPIATLSNIISERCVICTSPTKTFNLAGLQGANIIVSDDTVRGKIEKAGLSTGYSNLNAAVIAATKAVYLEGEEWLDLLLRYLQNNIKLVREFCKRTDGLINLIEPEGTYLLWLDCRNMKMNSAQLEDWFIDKVGIRLHNGSLFGKGGDGFMRMNVAAPKSIIEQALERTENQLCGK